MKSFFERISVWLLILFLIGCLSLVFLLLDATQEWGGIVRLIVKITSIISFLFLFIFFWLWLIYQSRREKIKLLKILSGVVALVLIIIISITLNKKSVNEQNNRQLNKNNKVFVELPKDIVKLGEIIYHPSEKIEEDKDMFSTVKKPRYSTPIDSTPYFSLEVENLSEKYCIYDIIVNITAYKDKVAFYKGKAALAHIDSFEVYMGRDPYRNFETNPLINALNPKGKTTLNCYISKVNPKTFPPKPWTFSTSVESIVGTPF